MIMRVGGPRWWSFADAGWTIEEALLHQEGGMKVLILALALAGCASNEFAFHDGKKHLTEAGKQEQQRQEEERQAECNRRGPPKIGMTKEQVFATCWGKTGRVNRTITANGTYEQYVYSDTSYLYFENGILIVIQN
jgi:hypothetical protein